MAANNFNDVDCFSRLWEAWFHEDYSEGAVVVQIYAPGGAFDGGVVEVFSFFWGHFLVAFLGR